LFKQNIGTTASRACPESFGRTNFRRRVQAVEKSQTLRSKSMATSGVSRRDGGHWDV